MSSSFVGHEACVATLCTVDQLNGWNTVSHRLANVFASLLDEDADACDSPRTNVSEAPVAKGDASGMTCEIASIIDNWSAVRCQLADVFEAALVEEDKIGGIIHVAKLPFMACVSDASTTEGSDISDGEFGDDESTAERCVREPRSRRRFSEKHRESMCLRHSEIRAWCTVGQRLASVLGAADLVDDEE